MKLLEELQARGLVQDVTNPEELSALLESSKLTFYAGYDPTSVSLQVGNLVPLSVMARLARAGHKMIAVVGGATGMVGDPSGKTSERKLLDTETLARNTAAMSGQIRAFVSKDALTVNNHDWTGGVSYLEFLRDVGKLITVNYMLGKESVRARLEDREQGISYTEFSYMLLQAWDYAWLAKHHDCRLQVGGSDQWGNITCGIELARKMGHEAQLFGMTTPFLLDAAGNKFGKSEKGALFLDAALTSPYRFYQFWLNTDDAQVERYLKMFSFLSLDEIAAVMAAHDPDRAKRIAQRKLAEEVTTWVHGPDQTRRAIAASNVMFGGSVADLTDADLEPLAADLPSTEIPRPELAAGIPIIDLLIKTKLADSKGAARRLIDGGGVYVNNVKVEKTDVARVIGEQDLCTESMLLLRSGKKSYHLLRVK